MIFKTFLSLEWKAFSRSDLWEYHLAIRIIFSIIIVGNLFILGLIAYFLPQILEQSGYSPLEETNKRVFYYVAFDFIIRFFFQKIPVAFITPYLHLPIKRINIINYLLLKSLWHLINIITIVFVAFFAIGTFGYESTTLAWFILILGLIMANNFSIFAIKMVLGNDFRKFLLVLILFLLLSFFHFYIISFQLLYRRLSEQIIEGKFYYLLFPCGLVLLSYIFLKKVLKANLYFE